MSAPSLAELREKGQPQAVLDRLNDEHWLGRLYGRKLSPYATWVFARLGWSPNAVTASFIVCGIAAGVVIAFGGLATAVIGALLIQLYLIFDCSDGELARWSNRKSASGVFLDGVGHYLGESAVLVGLGFRAQGHFTVAGGYVTAGVAAALLAMLVRAETDNVVVARAKAGLPAGHDDEALAPASAGLARARKLASVLQDPPDHPRGRALPADPGHGDHRRDPRRPDRDPRARRRVPGRGSPDGGGAPGRDHGLEAVALKLSIVILTMGNRPDELARAIESTAPLRAADAELVIIGNGADVGPVPPGVTTMRLAENAGVAGGRNAGVRACAGDVVLFLDDDGWYPEPAALGEHVAARFAADPQLAVLSFRVADPEGGPGGRWHVPRLRASDPERSSVVTTFAGGACAIRRSAYLEAGGQPDAFFFGHEETDLSWRLMDLGYRLEYDADATMCHPPVHNARHGSWYRVEARNRVWLARRNLPWPLAVVYLADWVAVTLLRERTAAALRAWFAGFAEGWTSDPGRRQPISLRTAWRMTRAGRPPLI